MNLRICGAASAAVVALVVWHFAGADSREAGMSGTQAVDSPMEMDASRATSRRAVPSPPISETPLVVHADLEMISPTVFSNGFWRFRGAAGQTVSITVRSEHFVPRVALLSPGGEEVARSDGVFRRRPAPLVARLSRPGDYTIRTTAVTTYADDPAQGPYTLALRTVEVERLALDAAPAGRLGAGTDAAGWSFAADGGELISVTARSDTDGVRVVLLGPDGERLAWGGSTPRSHLVAKLPGAGEYVIGVAALDAEPVEYELEVRTVEPGELALGTPVASRLTDGPRSEGWSFAGAAGQVVSVEARSDAFLPRIAVLSRDGGLLAWDDEDETSARARFDAEGESRFWRLSGFEGQVIEVTARSDTFNPRVSLLLPDGDARYALNYHTGGDWFTQMTLPFTRTGDYLLRVDAGYRGRGSCEVLARTVEVEELGPDRSGTGVLEPATQADVWRFPGVEGQVASVVARSDAFNPQVALLSPDGEELAWDIGSGPGTDSLLVATLPHTGEYLVVVSLFEGDAGPYEVAVLPARAEELAVGVPVERFLRPGHVGR